MALITCPECGAQVSDAALACPKCGRPQRASQHAPVATVTPVLKREGPFLQTLNFGCLLVLMLVGGVVLLFVVMSAIDATVKH